MVFVMGLQLVVLATLATVLYSKSASNIEVALTVCFLITFFILTTWKPYYGIYIFVSAAVIVGPSFLTLPYELEKRFFFYYYHFTIDDVKLYLNEMMIIIITLSIFVNMLLSRPNSKGGQLKIKSIDALHLWVLFFIFIGVLSILRGITKYGFQAAFGDGRIVFFSILFFLTIASFNSVDQVSLLFKVFFVSISVRLIINLLTPFLNPSYLYYEKSLYESLHGLKPFGSGTDAAYMGLSLIALIIRLIRYKNVKLKTLFLAIAFTTDLLLITSRSAIIAFLIILIIISLQANIIAKLKFLMAAFLISISLFMLIINIFPFFLENLSERYKGILGYAEDDTGVWRLISWNYGFEKISENPILGQGFGSYAQRWVQGSWVSVDLHNAYLDIALRMGLIGVIIFLIIFGKSMWNILIVRFKKPKYRFYADILFLSMIYLGVFIAFNADMREARAGTMLWIIFGLSHVLRKGANL
ncbi:MAG: O-antigen ligase family protein [Nitrososphaeria archaeon]